MTHDSSFVDARRRNILFGAAAAALVPSSIPPEISVSEASETSAIASKDYSPAKPSSHSVSYADLNGDGVDELLVSYLSGPHNTALQVYGMSRHWTFELLDELRSTTPSDFELEDIDNDGILEVTTTEISSSSSLPYGGGLRDRVTFKLTESGFKEIARKCCHSEEDIALAVAEWGSPNVA